MAPGDRKPASSGPSRFSSGTKSPRKTALGPHPFLPRSGIEIWFILLLLTSEGLSLSQGSAHSWAWRTVLDPETAVLRTKGHERGREVREDRLKGSREPGKCAMGNPNREAMGGVAGGEQAVRTGSCREKGVL